MPKKKKKVVKAKKRKGKKKKVAIKVRRKGKATQRSKKRKKGSPVVAYLGLGSNVGDREEYIEQAVFLLEKNPKIEVLKRSSDYETEAEGGKPLPPFINAALQIRTTLEPHELLEVCQEIETALGREREVEWGPRTIDVDILLYGDEILSNDALQIPHPLLHERLFVLLPLKEIAPQVVHPVLEKSIASLYEGKKTEAGDKYDDELPGFREIKSGNIDDFERW